MTYSPALDINTLSFIRTQIEAKLRQDFYVPNAPEPAWNVPEFWYAAEILQMVDDFLEYEDKAMDEYYERMNRETKDNVSA